MGDWLMYFNKYEFYDVCGHLVSRETNFILLLLQYYKIPFLVILTYY